DIHQWLSGQAATGIAGRDHAQYPDRTHSSTLSATCMVRGASMDSGRNEYSSFVRLFTRTASRIWEVRSRPIRASSTVSPVRLVSIQPVMPVGRASGAGGPVSRTTKALSILRTWLL